MSEPVPELRAIFIHGVGQQHPQFANGARAWLRENFKLWAASVCWAKYADKPEAEFLATVERDGSDGGPAQRLVVGTLADALMYPSSQSLRSQVFAELDAAWGLFPSGQCTIFAHSLGVLIATDWLRARPHMHDVRLVSLGCNLKLFSLGARFEPVPQLSRPGAWINCWHRRDMLGFPLRNTDPWFSHVRDVKVSLGGWFRGWTGLSHTLYWEDAALWRKTMPSLLGGRAHGS